MWINTVTRLIWQRCHKFSTGIIKIFLIDKYMLCINAGDYLRHSQNVIHILYAWIANSPQINVLILSLV